MVGIVLEIEREAAAEEIANKFDSWNNQRDPKMAEIKELRDYTFATDTTKTTNAELPWKNTTTIPKLCQIRDNLHANYMAALFPNDDWLKWEGYGEEDESAEKSQAIRTYMANKLRESNFRTTVSQLLYDYIDTGNVFATSIYEDNYTLDPDTNEKIQQYVGPRAVRRAIQDVVFNPMAVSYEKSPKIFRTLKSIGELVEEIETKPEMQYNKQILQDVINLRGRIAGMSADDSIKNDSFQVDGFGSITEYYGSGVVEILEFKGDMYDVITGEFLKDYVITVVDRTHVIRKVPNPSWLGSRNEVHAGWRLRSDNLYAMGPLDNLVGMQYRMDHLENLKADALDQTIHPPKIIRGNVEEFEWGPDAEIYVGDDGAVEIMPPNPAAFQVNNEIAVIANTMEEMAGAPKQAMGIRTPGEKTAFEVQQLSNAASRIFQEKITNFEVNVLEPLLNAMFESAKRNLDGTDVARVMDDDLGVVQFLKITKEDITAKGKLRPMGARHFAATAQLIQNLSSALQIVGGDTSVMSHVSGKKIAALFFEEIPGLERFDLVQDNIRLIEQAETQRMMNQIQEDLEVEAQTPVEGEDVEGLV